MDPHGLRLPGGERPNRACQRRRSASGDNEHTRPISASTAAASRNRCRMGLSRLLLYWKWRGLFYPDGLPTDQWFRHYARRFDTVEINASFYSWPTVANVKAWRRQPGKRDFVFTVKVCELITHIKRFKGTKTLIRDFGMIADILGDRMGCFLFQLPPGHRYTKARLAAILSQLDPARRNVVEFRHASWWNETVYAAFRRTGTIFCSCSGPRLPDELVRTADDVYLRLHGPERWYRHNYSKDELSKWADRITESGAKRAWVYFNNDYEAFAPKNATTMRRLFARSPLAVSGG